MGKNKSSYSFPKWYVVVLYKHKGIDNSHLVAYYGGEVDENVSKAINNVKSIRGSEIEVTKVTITKGTLDNTK